MIILPYAKKNPPDSFPAVSVILIAVNIIAFFLTTEYGFVTETMVEQYAVSRSKFEPLRVIASSFMHGDVVHLLGNMWFLYLFGWSVEGRLKTFKFILLYAVCTLASTAAQVFVDPQDLPMIGASGAVSGLMGAALLLFPFAKVKVFYWLVVFFFGTWLVPMWGVGIYYIAWDLLWGLVGLGDEGGGTAHFAHVGGALAGVALPLLLGANRDSAFVSEAKETLYDFKELSALNPAQLFDLARSQPESAGIANAWMGAEMNFGVVSDECQQHYAKHVKDLARDGELREVATVMHNLVLRGLPVNAGAVASVALRCEQGGFENIALVLYDQVMRGPKSDDRDREVSAFRLAQLHERMGNYAGASAVYRYYLQAWPMGSMESAARSGLRRVEGG
jgi:membrane associated rhomboid family serine protease